MVNSPARPLPVRTMAPSVPEQAQLALAMADGPGLRRLLADSLPVLALPHQVGSIGIQVGVPLGDPSLGTIDGVLTYERIVCVLAGGPDSVLPPPPTCADHSSYQGLTAYQSDLQTLAHNLPLSAAVALLDQVGFAPSQIDQILRLPSQGWHRSWWYSLTPQGQPAQPFQRSLRCRRFGDGRITLQYRDHYGQDAPSHFHSYPARLPVVVRATATSFGATLARINLARHSLGTDQALLIAETISELEVAAFLGQQVALISPLAVSQPLQVNCLRCGHRGCPLQGATTSVVVCRAYHPA